MLVRKNLVLLMLLSSCRGETSKEDLEEDSGENVISSVVSLDWQPDKLSLINLNNNLKTKISKEFFNRRRRRRKPLDGLLLGDSAARAAKNNTAVNIIMNKVRQVNLSYGP